MCFWPCAAGANPVGCGRSVRRTRSAVDGRSEYSGAGLAEDVSAAYEGGSPGSMTIDGGEVEPSGRGSQTHAGRVGEPACGLYG